MADARERLEQPEGRLVLALLVEPDACPVLQGIAGRQRYQGQDYQNAQAEDGKEAGLEEQLHGAVTAMEGRTPIGPAFVVARQK